MSRLVDRYRGATRPVRPPRPRRPSRPGRSRLVRRRRQLAWLVVAITSALLIAPIAAAPPATAAAASALVPAPRATGERATRISLAVSQPGRIETLPMVVRDLPDAPSQAAVAAFDIATVFHPDGAAAVFADSWQGLVVPAGADAEVAILRQDLLEAGFDVGPGGPYPGTIVPRGETAKPPGAIVGAFAALAAADPRNADRLTNAAIGYLFMGLANHHGLKGPLDVSTDLNNLGALRLLRFWELLRGIVTTWPAARAAVLDISFLRSAYPDPDVPLPLMLAPLEHLVSTDPTDGTARLLLGDLTSRRWDIPDALPRALAILQPLVDDSATARRGAAAIADAHLATALMKQRIAPFTAAAEARTAIKAYAAIDPSDPGIRAAIADALSLLGYPEDARKAMEEAVAADPSSISLGLELITLQEQVGDVRAMRDTARRLLRQALAGWDPPLAGLRLVPDPNSFREPGTLDSRGPRLADRGFGGFSIGRDRVHFPYPGVGGGGGAAFFVELDVVPRARGSDITVFRRTHLEPYQAALAAITASVDLGDPTGAAADFALWKPNADRFGAQSESDTLEMEYLPAAAVVAGQTVSTDVRSGADYRAEASLRWAGMFDRAAEVAGRAAAAATRPEDIVSERWSQGESLYLAGRYDDAAGVLRGADALTTADSYPRPYIRLSLAAALERGGHLAEARTAYQVAAVDPVTDAPGLVKVGDLALEAHDDGAAAEAYSLALAVAGNIEAGALEREDPVTLDAARASTRFARNGRGVARIRQAQALGAADRTCPDAALAACLGADEDFTAAIASDAANPIYRMNSAWSSRLLGDADRARTLLEEAVTDDPTLAPALDDLGVLAARAGDFAVARDAFERAIASAPDDPLPRWNLGVLEMALGPQEIVAAQGHLATAIKLRPEFRRDGIDYKPDEQVYRVTFGNAATGVGTPAAPGLDYGLAAVGLGSAGALGAAAAIIQFHAGITPAMGSTINALALPGLGGIWRRLRVRRHARRLRGSTSAGWRPWIPWVATVPVLIVVTTITTTLYNRTAPLTLIVQALFATVVALTVHEVGHVVVARGMRARVIPASWGPGTVLALLLAPLKLNAGPFLAEHVFPRTHPRATRAVWSGPLANLVLAALAYSAWFGIAPWPALRVLAQVSLAVAAFSLLPYRPLDGSVLVKRTPALVAVTALVIAATSLGLSTGII